jgi:RNA polymerase-interacting CarD/CdnL/TRCF family regulator
VSTAWLVDGSVVNTWARTAARRGRFPTPETGATDERTPLRLAVGDVVVYGFHGVALIAASEGDAAAPTAIALEFASGLRVTLPSARARESLRSLADESDLARVEEILRADESASEAQWAKRFRATREKVVAGQVTGLAEVVRDGAHREHRQALRSGTMPSPAERELYVQARRLLAGEVGAVRGIDLPTADAWITEQIDAAIEAQANEPPGSASKRRRRKTDG